MKTTTKLGLGAALLAATLATPATLRAQTAGPTAGQVEVDALRARASEESESRDGFLEASLLFRRAATLQGDRPEAVEDLVRAATLAYYAGREGDAVDDLDRAAETALEWGDVLTAAEAWLDAAWVSWKRGDTEDAAAFATRAERLSHSPLIQREERRAILSRLSDLDR